MAGILRLTDLQQMDGTPFQYSPRSITTFTASGTWTKPAWCKSVRVRMVGGGGGGSGYCEAGGGGGYCELVIQNPPATVAVTVGIGGAQTTYAGAGIQGGTSSFGTYCSATGGYGANSQRGHNGGAGGYGIGGNINTRGGGGSSHVNPGHNAGLGGPSYFGGANPGGHSAGIKWDAGSPGTGGNGASATSNPNGATIGAPGENGIVIVEEYN